MALAIDTRHLIERWLPDQEDYLDTYVGIRGRFQLHRVLASATVAHICTSTTSIKGFDHRDAQQAALNWQADPEDDLHEEVFHRLQQLVASTSTSSTRTKSISRSSFPDESAIVTTLVASVESPSFILRVKNRPPSAFHRYSVKMIMEEKGNGHTYASKTSLSDVIPDVTRRGRLWACVHDPKILWASIPDHQRSILSVVWHIQLDFVDLHTRTITTHPDSRRSSRSRTTLNRFQQVPMIHSRSCEEEEIVTDHTISSRDGPDDCLPEAKRFKGVRYRHDRKKWVAEMKPPKSKNKVSFGDFKSQMQAARAVDAAFHHFGKPLNFPDTPQILSTLVPITAPSSSGVLNDELATMKLVKENAKRLAFVAESSSLPISTPTSVPSTTPPPASTSSEPFEVSDSSTVCTAVTGGRFRSFSEIMLSPTCGGSDEADDGISQLDPMACFVESTTDHPDMFTDHRGVLVNFNELDESPRMFLRGVDYAMVDQYPCTDVLISSAEVYSSGTRSTHYMDSDPELDQLQPFKIPRTCMADFLILSPTAPSAFHLRNP